jgi:hypothetical protein
MKTLKTIIVALAAAAALPFSANATTINGSVLLHGTGSVSVSAGFTTFTPNNDWKVLAGDDDYSTVLSGTAVSKLPVKYTGTGTGATLVAPVVPEWKFTFAGKIYSFDLTSLDNGLFVAGSPNNFGMSGSGVAHITGFDDTVASWSLEGTGSGFNFKFASESTTALGVPDGGATAMLLGVGLLGLGALRRKA